MMQIASSKMGSIPYVRGRVLTLRGVEGQVVAVRRRRRQAQVPLNKGVTVIGDGQHQATASHVFPSSTVPGVDGRCRVRLATEEGIYSYLGGNINKNRPVGRGGGPDLGSQPPR